MRNIVMITIVVFFLTSVTAQTKEEIIEYFEEAKFFFDRDDYKEAAYYYKRVLEQYPDNANFNFKLGECYMHIPGAESQAVPYFEKAVKSTVEKKMHKPRSFEEKNAPLHAYFYLGIVYRINNQLDEALTAYNTFISSPYYYGNYNETIVENEIKACERAKIIQDNPIDLTEELLPDPFNTDATEIYPVISGDEKTLVFVRKLKFYDAIFESHNDGSGWSQLINLNPLVGSDGDFYPTCLSYDGKELYLVKTSSGNRDLYVSYYRDNTWTKAEKLGKTINTPANETSACLSEDGRWLFFSSDRGSGKKGFDIYISERKSVNQWGKAKNAGKNINTEFDEDSPCLTNQGKTLYFSSRGHYSMGGFDLFYANKKDKKWATPVNAGYPVNTTADNNNMTVIQGGRIIYLSKINTTGNASEDLYKLHIHSYLPLP
ncbi:MAG: PD40 domain-containing protein [Bacteroidales bacterium]|nr:PD40 domain-containing protein [Bacteroidales bacterium]